MATVNSVVNKNIGLGLSPKDLAILAAAKLASERITAPYIGMGTVKSGLIKLGASLGATILVKNKYVRLAAVGVGLDGAEDLVEVAYKKANGIKAEVTNSEGNFKPVL